MEPMLDSPPVATAATRLPAAGSPRHEPLPVLGTAVVYPTPPLALRVLTWAVLAVGFAALAVNFSSSRP
jgi:hypothetical protein